MVRTKGKKRSYVMAALVLVGGALFLSGVAGGAAFPLWPIGCMGMMVAMMWGMRGTGEPAQHTHPNGVTHSPDDEHLLSSRQRQPTGARSRTGSAPAETEFVRPT